MKYLIVFSLIFLFSACISSTAATTSKSDALISGPLPGQSFATNFTQYAGYITVDAKLGKNLFYWFQLSQRSPASDPVVLWLNGGPGCSSIGGGAMEENGFYRPTYSGVSPDGSKNVGVTSNPWAWNRAANVIFLDSPAGVGYSYSVDPAGLVTDVNITAQDTTRFLEIFFQQVYPEFAGNVFWITGESYAGIYIPTLAYNVLANSSDAQLVANLKRGGLMMGNPVTGCDGTAFKGPEDVHQLNTQLYNFYYHAMVSPRLFTQWNANGCNLATPPSLSVCQSLYATAYESVGTFHQPLRQQQLAADKTSKMLNHQDKYDGYVQKQWDRLEEKVGIRTGQINPDCLYYSFCVGNATLEFMEDSNAECFSVDDQIAQYLNTPAVQSALHAKPKHWRACGGVVFNQNVKNIIPYIESFFESAPSMRILYYSGDIDIATVPISQTERCLETMGRPVVDPWRPWGFNSEIAGYVEIYDTYTFATLKAAGHEAPAYQPASAYYMFTSFLNNQKFPRS